jgi:hypothetical protein
VNVRSLRALLLLILKRHCTYDNRAETDCALATSAWEAKARLIFVRAGRFQLKSAVPFEKGPAVVDAAAQGDHHPASDDT